MICENCGQEHDGSYASGRFCSPKCSRSYSARVNNEKRISKIKVSAKKAIAEGKHHSFDGGRSSIVEKYWYEELTKSGLVVRQTHPVSCDSIDNNNHYYYLDFLVGDHVDLEIDGIFHNDPEVSQKDQRRDDYLKSLGYLVYRVPYINPKRRYNDFMKQVSEFVDWYNNLNS